MSDKMVWLDIETTGLDPQADSILEIGIAVTSPDLIVLAEWEDLVVPNRNSLENMNEFVKQMHTASGLLKRIPIGSIPRSVEQRALDFIQRFVLPKEVPLCGSTISFDRSFLKVHMPELDNYFHYRSIDVSSIKELAKYWYPQEEFSKGREQHTVREDIIDSIGALRQYRYRLFRRTPYGPEAVPEPFAPGTHAP